MMNSEPRVRKFTDLNALANDLAGELAADLAAAIAARGSASLVVSGGRSPIALFESLRTREVNWGAVHLALADERWVDPADPQSNEHLVRTELLRERVAQARFRGLKIAAPSPELGAAEAWRTFAAVPRPFDALILGMGDDGHTASLFPASPNLPAALDAQATPGCVGMRAPSAPQARLSLNLAALLDSRRIVLLLTGAQKWRTYEAAAAPGPVADMPIRAVLRQGRVPVQVFWSP